MERTLDLQAKRLAISREALFCTALAATLATLVAWLGPPGTDFAAHAYQRALFIRHGFTLWDNFWYAGSYSFADYSLLYYPLAAWVGIRILAVAAVSVAVLAFTVVAGREWGSRARWASRSFAVVWAGFLISAGFPFALGFAFALLALWALQTGHRWRFATLTLLTLAASPLALVLLIVVVAAIALSRRTATRNAAGVRQLPPARPPDARRNVPACGPLVAVLAGVHGMSRAGARRDASAGHARSGDGSDRVRRRRPHPAEHARRGGADDVPLAVAERTPQRFSLRLSTTTR